MHTDAFIKGRILWRASKHRLPDHDTREFGDAPTEVRDSFDELCGSIDIGLPVLVFGSTTDRWTVVGTRGVVSRHHGTVHCCAYPQITKLSSARPHVQKADKEYLAVSLAEAPSVQLWAPRGSQFFALWNIVLGLSRMHAADDRRK